VWRTSAFKGLVAGDYREGPHQREFGDISLNRTVMLSAWRVAVFTVPSSRILLPGACETAARRYVAAVKGTPAKGFFEPAGFQRAARPLNAAL